MKRYQVVFSELARRQLNDLYEYIADHAHPEIALGYIERIEALCRGLETLPERGTARPDLRPGLRIIGLERRATIAFAVTKGRVIILQVFYGGQDIDGQLGENGAK